MELSIENLSNKIRSVALQYDLSAVWLFGSYAKDTQSTDSDIDLIVKTEDVIEGFKLIEVKYALEEALERNVDLITTNSIVGSLLENEDLGELLIFEKKEK